MSITVPLAHIFSWHCPSFCYLRFPEYLSLQQQQRQPPSQQSTVASYRKQLLPFLMRGFCCFQCHDSSSHVQNKFPRHHFCAAQVTDLKKGKQSRAFLSLGRLKCSFQGRYRLLTNHRQKMILYRN